jgi:hypothetical protein
VQFATEQFETDDRVDDDDKQDEHGDVQQRDHGAQNGVQDDLHVGGSETVGPKLNTSNTHLQARDARHESQRSQHSKCA